MFAIARASYSEFRRRGALIQDSRGIRFIGSLRFDGDSPTKINVENTLMPMTDYPESGHAGHQNRDCRTAGMNHNDRALLAQS
jgi:hypothetical protein